MEFSMQISKNTSLFSTVITSCFFLTACGGDNSSNSNITYQNNTNTPTTTTPSPTTSTTLSTTPTTSTTPVITPTTSNPNILGKEFGDAYSGDYPLTCDSVRNGKVNKILSISKDGKFSVDGKVVFDNQNGYGNATLYWSKDSKPFWNFLNNDKEIPSLVFTDQGVSLRSDDVYECTYNKGLSKPITNDLSHFIRNRMENKTYNVDCSENANRWKTTLRFLPSENIIETDGIRYDINQVNNATSADFMASYESNGIVRGYMEYSLRLGYNNNGVPNIFLFDRYERPSTFYMQSPTMKETRICQFLY